MKWNLSKRFFLCVFHFWKGFKQKKTHYILKCGGNYWKNVKADKICMQSISDRKKIEISFIHNEFIFMQEYREQILFFTLSTQSIKIFRRREKVCFSSLMRALSNFLQNENYPSLKKHRKINFLSNTIPRESANLKHSDTFRINKKAFIT